MSYPLTAIAERIPAAYRTEILEMSMIDQAQASSSDATMGYLFTIWKNYVEPEAELDMACGACLVRILKSFRALQPLFVEAEKKSRLLDKL